MNKRIPAALSAVLVFAAGCSSSTPSHDMGSMPSMAPSSSASPASSAVYDDADVMFVTMMIPHHQQAVQMSDILLAKTGVDEPVRGLATTIKQAQAPEIATMQGWLAAWGSPTPGVAMDHGMDHGDMGMMSEAELATLTQADGATGQRVFLAAMIKHHQGAVAMAEQVVGSGQNPDVKALAQSIITSQRAEITQMQKLQAS